MISPTDMTRIKAEVLREISDAAHSGSGDLYIASRGEAGAALSVLRQKLEKRAAELERQAGEQESVQAQSATPESERDPHNPNMQRSYLKEIKDRPSPGGGDGKRVAAADAAPTGVVAASIEPASPSSDAESGKQPVAVALEPKGTATAGPFSSGEAAASASTTAVIYCRCGWVGQRCALHYDSRTDTEHCPKCCKQLFSRHTPAEASGTAREAPSQSSDSVSASLLAPASTPDGLVVWLSGINASETGPHPTEAYQVWLPLGPIRADLGRTTIDGGYEVIKRAMPAPASTPPVNKVVREWNRVAAWEHRNGLSSDMSNAGDVLCAEIERLERLVAGAEKVVEASRAYSCISIIDRAKLHLSLAAYATLKSEPGTP